MITKGMKSSEFVASLIGALGLLAVSAGILPEAFAESITNNLTELVMMIAAYAVSRGLAKSA